MVLARSTASTWSASSLSSFRPGGPTDGRRLSGLRAADWRRRKGFQKRAGRLDGLGRREERARQASAAAHLSHARSLLGPAYNLWYLTSARSPTRSQNNVLTSIPFHPSHPIVHGHLQDPRFRLNSTGALPPIHPPAWVPTRPCPVTASLTTPACQATAGSTHGNATSCPPDVPGGRQSFARLSAVCSAHDAACTGFCVARATNHTGISTRDRTPGTGRLLLHTESSMHVKYLLSVPL